MSNKIKKMIDKYIEEYNNLLLKKDLSKLSLGLFGGKMGLCIYFAHQYKLYGDKAYEKKAYDLLNDIYYNANKLSKAKYKNELANIGIGFHLLTRTGLFGGNLNNVLKELDDYLISYLNTEYDITPEAFKNTIPINIWNAIYLCKRCKDKGIGTHDIYVYHRFIMELLNVFDKHLIIIIEKEPYNFSPLNNSLLLFLCFIIEISELHIYDYKVERTCKIWCDKLTSIFPISIGHRYILGLLYKKISELIVNEDISNRYKLHAELLLSNSDISKFLQSEICSNGLSITDGVTGLYYFAKFCNLELEENNLKQIFEKINSSNLWNDKNIQKTLFDGKKSLNGIPGIFLAYQSLNDEIK